MKRAQLKNVLLLVCVVSLFLSGCHSAPKLESETRNVSISINATRAKIFEVATLAFIKGGFTISVANESIGLITTDYKRVDVGFKEAFHLALSDEKGDPEVQFGTTITETGSGSILTMVVKGRTWSRKKGYQPYVFNDEFMNSVRIIGEQIKAQAEAK